MKLRVIVSPVVSLLLNFAAKNNNNNMGWHDTWDDILKRQGPPRWKVDDLEAKAIALKHIETHSSSNNCADGENSTKQNTSLKIFCPLAGDDPFVHYAWNQGHDVTALDLVPAAVEAMKKQFGGTWEKEQQDETTVAGGTVVWKHESGRATLYQGDVLVSRPELFQKFNAIYDKDSFGALDKSMRKEFCQRLSDYTSENGIVYVEVKKKADTHPQKDLGPPFSVLQEDLMERSNFGTRFDYVASLGKLYDIRIPGMSQTGHILKRVMIR